MISVIDDQWPVVKDVGATEKSYNFLIKELPNIEEERKALMGMIDSFQALQKYRYEEFLCRTTYQDPRMMPFSHHHSMQVALKNQGPKL